MLDEKMLMHTCIDKLYRKAKPKARALLRCRRLFSISDMLALFKAHVRSQVEWCNGAIYHASPAKLAHLDSVQSSFLRHLELDENSAFLTFNLALLKFFFFFFVYKKLEPNRPTQQHRWTQERRRHKDHTQTTTQTTATRPTHHRRAHTTRRQHKRAQRTLQHH